MACKRFAKTMPDNSVLILFVSLTVAACVSRSASTAELAGYAKLRGDLTDVERTPSGTRGRYGVERVRLRSSTGLVASGWVYHPATSGGCHAAVLLQDGREENADVIARLPLEFGDVVVLSLDYPASMPSVLQLRDVIDRREQIQHAARQIPALFSLGAAYLRTRDDVDTARIAIAATSFAVPFATIAAAFDTTFRNVALVYGAGDLPTVIAANLALRPRFLRRPLAWIATRPFREFAPERFIARITPRPIAMVNGMDDPQMPVSAVRELYDAAREPKSIAWLRTGHLMPSDSALIRRLVDTAFALIPVLKQPAAPERCRSLGLGRSAPKLVGQLHKDAVCRAPQRRHARRVRRVVRAAVAEERDGAGCRLVRDEPVHPEAT